MAKKPTGGFQAGQKHSEPFSLWLLQPWMAYQEKERAFCFELCFSKCFLHGSQSSTSIHNAQKIRLPTNGKYLQEAGLRESEMLVFEIKVL